ncbi:MAG: hypothetical protein JW862_19450, partial [Anaerolineales bacterium]|nr:hypothetical protein [Anaerolineales bacterium]
MSAAPTGKTLPKARLSPNDWLRVYLFALLPLILILMANHWGILRSLTSACLVLGVSLLAASLQPALGASLILAIVLFSFLDPLAVIGLASEWTLRSFWTGLIVPFLLLALALQWQVAQRRTRRLRWLRVALIGAAIGLGCLAAWLVHGRLPGVYLWSALACAAALMWINSGGLDKAFDSDEGTLGFILGFISWAVASWQWYGVLFSTGAVAWLHYLLRALFTLAGVAVLYMLTVVMIIQGEEFGLGGSQERPEVGLRRYFFFGSFLILGVLFPDILHALLATALATVLFSLLYPVLGKFKPGTRPARYPAVALSAFPALFMATLLLYESGWLLTIYEFVIFKFQILAGWHYLWTLLIVALLITLTGSHWVSYLSAGLLWLALIIGWGLSDPAVLLFAALWVGLGAVIGMRRVLLWPFASAYLTGLARRIAQSQDAAQIKVLRQRAAAVLDWGIWPAPLGQQAILVDFGQAGLTPEFESARLQERFRRVQEESAAAR